MTRAWWDVYFNRLYLDMFQRILNPDRSTREVEGITSLLEIDPGAHILDLCCGQGRHAVRLSRAGFSVTGLDRSKYLLEQAQEEASKANATVTWVRGDMRLLPWRAQFDACINLFTAFGYFSDEAENQQVLYQVERVLKPGGWFFLDVSNRDYDLQHLWPKAWHRDGQTIILEEAEFDPLTCRFTLTLTRLQGEKTESIRHSVRHYTAPELSTMLRRAGLEPVEIYGDFDGTPFHLHSPRMIVVARK
jgi:ubiquinone/menaquinone biosynthesis C-methylase UbiE